jgi:hypothetical protein
MSKNHHQQHHRRSRGASSQMHHHSSIRSSNVAKSVANHPTLTPHKQNPLLTETNGGQLVIPGSTAISNRNSLHLLGGFGLGGTDVQTQRIEHQSSHHNSSGH